jgi:arylsulfatase
VAVAWPARIKEAGGIRHQFHHVIDIVPTIIEAAGIQQPVMVDGIAQKSIEGVSMAYTWDRANANAPTTHRTQYFEMVGNRVIYHDGWYANTRPINAPWNLASTLPTDVMNSFKWELYDLTKDWTQDNDLAAANPAKLKEMQELFMMEAAKYQVFPLDNTLATRMVKPRPSVTAGRSIFTYSGELTGIPMGDAPQLRNTACTSTAEVEMPETRALGLGAPQPGDGMSATQGGRFGGWGFYVLKGKPVYVWNLLDLKRVRWEGAEALSPGKHTLEFDFKYDGLGFATLAFNNTSGIGRGGTGVLKVDGRVVATQTMERTIPLTLQWDETFDVGADTGTPVDDKDYQVPFRFSGKLNKLTIKVDRPELSPEDIKKLEAGMQQAADAK